MLKSKLLFAACCSIILNSSFVLARPLSSHTLHTHSDTRDELKPIHNSFQIAASTFLPEWVDSLSVYSSPTNLDFSDIAEQNRIFSDCVLKGFNRTSCPENSRPDDFCPESSAYFKNCLSFAQICSDAGYTLSCNPGYIKDNANLCPEDNNYGKCIPNPCEGYEYSLSEAAAAGYTVGSKCLSGEDEKYQRIPAACPGFTYDTSNCGAGAQCRKPGGSTCQSGETVKYSECNPCPVAVCDLPQLNLETYYCDGALKCLIP